MRKIINGRAYDTNTAVCYGTAEYWSGGDFDNYQEDLYLKKTGEFFVCGWDACTGSYIRPLSVAGAKEWVEEYLDADTYEVLFGPVDE